MNRVYTIILAAAVSALTLASQTVLAHGTESHDVQKAANGGQLRTAGNHHFELLVSKDSKDAKENPVVVYVTDNAGKKVPTTGASGTATILAGKSKASAALVPDGDNRLKGTANYASSPDMKVVVSIALPGKTADQARFTPFTTEKDATGEKR